MQVPQPSGTRVHPAHQAQPSHPGLAADAPAPLLCCGRQRLPTGRGIQPRHRVLLMLTHPTWCFVYFDRNMFATCTDNSWVVASLGTSGMREAYCEPPCANCNRAKEKVWRYCEWLQKT